MTSFPRMVTRHEHNQQTCCVCGASNTLPPEFTSVGDPSKWDGVSLWSVIRWYPEIPHGRLDGAPWCWDCLPTDLKTENFGRVSQEEAIPGVYVLGLGRCGTSVLCQILANSGYWMGICTNGYTCVEDEWAMQLAVKSMAACGLDHSHPAGRVNFEIVDQTIHEMAPEFLAHRRKTFRWGFSYPTMAYGAKAWLEVDPTCRLIFIVARAEAQCQAVLRQADNITRSRVYQTMELQREALMRVEGDPRVLFLHTEDLSSHTDIFYGMLEDFLRHAVSKVSLDRVMIRNPHFLNMKRLEESDLCDND